MRCSHGLALTSVPVLCNALRACTTSAGCGVLMILHSTCGRKPMFIVQSACNGMFYMCCQSHSVTRSVSQSWALTTLMPVTQRVSKVLQLIAVIHASPGSRDGRIFDTPARHYNVCHLSHALCLRTSVDGSMQKKEGRAGMLAYLCASNKYHDHQHNCRS